MSRRKRSSSNSSLNELLNEYLITGLVELVTSYIHPRVALLYNTSHVVLASDITTFPVKQHTLDCKPDDVQDICVLNNELVFINQASQYYKANFDDNFSEICMSTPHTNLIFQGWQGWQDGMSIKCMFVSNHKKSYSINMPNYADTCEAYALTQTKPDFFATTETHLICVSRDRLFYASINISQYDHVNHRWSTIAETDDPEKVQGLCGSTKWIVVNYENHAQVYNRENKTWQKWFHNIESQGNDLSLSNIVVFDDSVYFFSASLCDVMRTMQYDLVTLTLVASTNTPIETQVYSSLRRALVY